MGSSYEFQRGGKKKISDVCRMKIKNNIEHLTTSMETQCLSKSEKQKRNKLGRKHPKGKKQIENDGEKETFAA